MKRKMRWVAMILAVFGLLMGASAAWAEKVNLTGNWLLTVTSAQGTGNPLLILKQDGDKLSGTYKGRFGEAPATGCISGTDFEIVIEQQMKVTFKGKYESGRISGKIDFGGQSEADFTGEKK